MDQPTGTAVDVVPEREIESEQPDQALLDDLDAGPWLEIHYINGERVEVWTDEPDDEDEE